MKRLLLCVLSAVAMAVGLPTAQAPSRTAVQRLDPALDRIVSVDAKLELLKGDYFGFLEGPVWVPEGADGFLLFSDLPANAIYKWTPKGELSVFRERSGFTGTDTSTAGMELNNGRLHVFLLGSNGLTLDRQRRVVFCAHGDRAIVRLEEDGRRTVLADRYEGKRLNSPNDLVMRSDGALYFTDPSYGLRGADKSPLMELSFHGVFLLKDGTLQLLDKDPQGAPPNGIAFSPDEKHLYVGAGRKIMRYDVRPNGTIANGRVFVDMTEDKTPGGVDGMKVDRNGNIYSTGPGGVWIISPEGKHLGTIPVAAANLAFGDADGKGLYFAARRDLYRLRVNVQGVSPRSPSK